MTKQQKATNQISLIELQLLMSQSMKEADCSLVVEMAQIAREALGDPNAPLANAMLASRAMLAA